MCWVPWILLIFQSHFWVSNIWLVKVRQLNRTDLNQNKTNSCVKRCLLNKSSDLDLEQKQKPADLNDIEKFT